MKHNQIAAGVLSLILAGCAASVPTQNAATIEVPAPSAETPIAFTEAGVAALEAQMKQFVVDGHVYGIHTRLVQDGAIVSETQFGLRDVIKQEPIEDDTIYRIYSMTKPITGAAMMQLYEQGKWKLDDPVTKFVPEFSDLLVLSGQDEDGNWQYVKADRPPTMREVMNHTAGFAYGLFGDDPANTAFRDQRILGSANMKEFVDRTAEVPLLFQPGARWSYSASVDVQGAIVERISGQSFGEYLEEHIFAPLGMEDSAFYVPDEKRSRFSQVFGYNPEDGKLVPLPEDYVLFNLGYKKETLPMESGGGGLVSTMDDYAAFCQMMLNGGELNGVRVLEEKTAEQMTANSLPDGMSMWSSGSGSYNADGLGFGLGFGIVTDPSVRDVDYGQGSYFWGGAAGTWFWIDPENDLYFIGMIQRFPTGAPEEVDFRTTSAKLVYDAIAK